MELNQHELWVLHLILSDIKYQRMTYIDPDYDIDLTNAVNTLKRKKLITACKNDRGCIELELTSPLYIPTKKHTAKNIIKKRMKIPNSKKTKKIIHEKYWS